jgi:uncharacterized protein (TIGR03083 family)
MPVSLTLVPKQPTIDALADVWSSTRELLTTLDDHQWTAPSPLPGWDVAANVAHVIGTEAMLLGIDSPSITVDRVDRAHVRNDIGSFNEAWVLDMAGMAPAELIERFTNFTAQRLEALQSMDDAGWCAEAWTPVGKESYGRFMRIRVFDSWMHEQDIRDAVGRPGHESGPAVTATLDEMAAALGYVVGKRAAAPAGSTVTYRLTGDAARDVHIEVGERAALVDSLPAEPTVTLTMPVGVFTRLGGGRIGADEAAARIRVDGDAELGRRLIANGAYTI